MAFPLDDHALYGFSSRTVSRRFALFRVVSRTGSQQVSARTVSNSAVASALTDRVSSADRTTSSVISTAARFEAPLFVRTTGKATCSSELSGAWIGPTDLHPPVPESGEVDRGMAITSDTPETDTQPS